MSHSVVRVRFVVSETGALYLHSHELAVVLQKMRR